jgi:hypothetical protein
MTPNVGPANSLAAVASREGEGSSNPLGLHSSQMERTRMPRTVAAYHCAPPCAIATPARVLAVAPTRSFALCDGERDVGLRVVTVSPSDG